MAKLIPLEEAAKYLGVTPDQLVEMRSRNEVAGYRDGSSWKFKQAELDRVKDSLSGGGPEMADDLVMADDDDAPLVLDDADDLAIDLGDDLGDDLKLEDASSISLGDDLKLEDASASSISLGDDDDLKLSDEGDSILVTDDLGLEGERSTSSTVIGKEDHDVASAESDLRLAPVDDGQSVGADVTLAGGSDLQLSLDDDDDEDMPLVAAEESGLGLVTDDDDDDELVLSGGSDASPVVKGGGDFDDDELVLDDVDVTLSGDSGINLTSPSDSGISLESLDDEELQLDDDMVSVDDDGELAAAGGEDAFDLTPNEDLTADDDESSSQVIALDPDQFVGGFEEDAAVTDAGGLVEEEAVDFGEEAAVAATAASAAGAAATRGADDGMDLSGGNIIALSCLSLLMLLCGIIVVDVIRNIWSWSGNGFSDTLVGALAGLLTK